MKAIISDWNESRGFGFAKSESNKKIFIHYSSAVPREGHISFQVGQEVELECYETTLGYEGKNVRKT